MAIGEVLRSAREDRGLSLKAVENDTKIRTKYLEAMEEENFAVLPGKVYAKAFLRTYAKYLGLDSDDLTAEFNHLYSIDDGQGVDQSPTVEGDAPRKPSRLLSYLLVTLVVAGIFGLGALYRSAINSDTPAPNHPSPSPVAEDKGLNDEGAGEDEQTVPAGVDLVLRVEGAPSWMRVKVDGKVSFEGTVPSGQSLSFIGKEIISVRVGNAGSVRATLNGNDLGVLGSPGQVSVRDFTQG